MKKLLNSLLMYLLVLLGIGLLVVLLPATPKDQRYMNFTLIEKDSLLQYVKAPRMIMIGGSNVGMSLNSEIIKDSLEVNPINTAIHAKLGLKFMLDNTAKNLQSGDVVLVIPEYEQFLDKMFWGAEDLTGIITGVSSSKFILLDFDQWINIMPYIPRYLKSKFNLSNYLYREKSLSRPYLRSSYNSYGDAVYHWSLQSSKEWGEVEPLENTVNEIAIEYLVNWVNKQKERGIDVYVMYPTFKNENYKVSENVIQKIDNLLRKTNLKICGTPEDFVFEDSLFFDTHYHLRQPGVDMRTLRLIELYKKELHNKEGEK